MRLCVRVSLLDKIVMQKLSWFFVLLCLAQRYETSPDVSYRCARHSNTKNQLMFRITVSGQWCKKSADILHILPIAVENTAIRNIRWVFVSYCVRTAMRNISWVFVRLYYTKQQLNFSMTVSTKRYETACWVSVLLKSYAERSWWFFDIFVWTH